MGERRREGRGDVRGEEEERREERDIERLLSESEHMIDVGPGLPLQGYLTYKKTHPP